MVTTVSFSKAHIVVLYEKESVAKCVPIIPIYRTSTRTYVPSWGAVFFLLKTKNAASQLGYVHGCGLDQYFPLRAAPLTYLDTK